MTNKIYYLCVFQSRNQAILIFSLLESAGYKNFQLISTPCGIKAGCSYSIKFSHYNYYEVINKRVDELGLVKPRLFYINTVNGKTNYDEIHI